MSESLEGLNLSGDEIKRISDAMKDEKFRKLFVEYAEELSDPENRRLYEEELSRLENERGMDITFVNPTPGYVLKTSLNGERKAFINICQSDKIDKPSGKREKDSGRNGLMWYLPHSFAPPREDLDKNGQKCQVYDVVFHPDTYRMAESNQRFKKLVEDTALDGIEKQFDAKLDRKNLKRPNMKFKGTPTATVIRTKLNNGAPNTENEFLKKLPNPYEDKVAPKKVSENKIVEEKNKKNSESAERKGSEPTVPKYSIIHRSELDLQEYTNNQANKKSTRPKELVVTIQLPLLKSAASADLDIFEKRLVLESKEPAAYKLDLMLPYPVNDEEGSAKFDKSKHSLIVTLPVVPDKLDEQHTTSIMESEGTDGLKDSVVENQPLIEVLPAAEDQNSNDNKSLEPLLDAMPTDAGEPASIISSNSIIFQKPDFTFTQDTETVNFVINVKNISRDSVTTVFPNPHSIHLKFLSMGSGGFPMNYSLYIQFAEECQIAEDHCSVDVSNTALIMLILKSKDSRREWNGFKAGVDVNSLEDQLFLTESNLQLDLDKLDQEANHKFDIRRKTEVCVSEMSQKKLTIKLQKLSLKEEEEDYEAPLSSDIEIVHTTVPPKLHSILKQRTISESSDDHHISPTSDSPRSDDDIHKLQRSVSFNNRVDSTSFHSNKCPQSVKTTLHNKRKKARRKENLKQARAERKRSNSTGSEYSSGEDQSDTQTNSDSPLLTDDFEKINEEAEDANVEVSKLAHAISKGFTEGSPERCICQGKSDSTVKKDEVVTDRPLDFRTSGSKKKRNKGKGKGKKPYQGESKCDKSATDSEGNSDRGAVEITDKSDDIQQNKAANVNDANGQNKTDLGAEKKEGKLNGITLGSSSIKNGDLKKMAEESDSSVVRIVASGEGEAENAEKADSDDDVEETATSLNTLTNNEHRTQCAFQFSNSVIFDLDND